MKKTRSYFYTIYGWAAGTFLAIGQSTAGCTAGFEGFAYGFAYSALGLLLGRVVDILDDAHYD
jgi:hypothetical protein